MGAPLENRNAMTFGMSSMLTSGRLPKGAGYCRRHVLAMGRELAVAVNSQRGKVTTRDSLAINAAQRHELRAVLLHRRYRLEGGNLTVEQEAMLLREIGRATDARDRAIDRLRLDAEASPQAAALQKFWQAPAAGQTLTVPSKEHQ